MVDREIRVGRIALRGRRDAGEKMPALRADIDAAGVNHQRAGGQGCSAREDEDAALAWLDRQADAGERSNLPCERPGSIDSYAAGETPAVAEAQSRDPTP